MTEFAALGITEPVLRALREMGFEEPTPVQARAIPPLMQGRDGAWTPRGSWPPAHGSIVHPAVMYHRRVASLVYDVESWRVDEPADWNLWRRMRDAGARMGFVDRVVCRHYVEAREVKPTVPPWIG